MVGVLDSPRPNPTYTVNVYIYTLSICITKRPRIVAAVYDFLFCLRRITFYTFWLSPLLPPTSPKLLLVRLYLFQTALRQQGTYCALAELFALFAWLSLTERTTAFSPQALRVIIIANIYFIFFVSATACSIFFFTFVFVVLHSLNRYVFFFLTFVPNTQVLSSVSKLDLKLFCSFLSAASY